MKEKQADREDRQDGRDRKGDAPEAHEVELRVVWDDPQQRDGGKKTHRRAYEIASFWGRVHLTHQATIKRVRVKAVKTVVMMPTPGVTAKPPPGPVPMKNRIAAAMNVVMFESRMVASARVNPASIAEI